MFSNAKQRIPEVFIHIINNQSERAYLKAGKVIPFKAVQRYRALRDDMNKSLRPAAERLLRWNTDKGDGKPNPMGA